MDPIDLTNQLFNTSGNSVDPTKPLYHGTRQILGLYDLVVSFKTNRCSHSCNFCQYSMMSEETTVSKDQLIKQIEWMLTEYDSELRRLEQISVRNEGSVLNPRQFYPEALDYLITRVGDLPLLKKLHLETRLEYASEARLRELTGAIGPGIKLELAVGFETQDEHIRNTVLGKKLNLAIFEERVGLLGRQGVSLTAYVMLKPDPQMSEQEGIQEALKSVDYLADLCRRSETNLTIYVNPVFAAKGSKLAIEMELKGYTSPTRESINTVMAEANKKDIKIYTDPI
ncbi:MAG: hypothetical protein AABX47_07300 [Nanoarchaeota archaeon]